MPLNGITKIMTVLGLIIAGFPTQFLCLPMVGQTDSPANLSPLV